jgi:Protein of unknown function (DUF2914)
MTAPASGDAPSPASSPAEPAATGTAPSVTTSSTLRMRVQAWRERNATREMVFFLLAGFVFDVVTLSRIDDWATLAQQGAYLGLLGALLLLEQRDALGLAAPPAWLAKVWRFSEDAIHFLFGSLLSSFALFYFKSADVLTSFAFLAVLFGLLVGNELPRFRALGPVMRVALFSLCLTSYLAYLLPVLVGVVRAWLFVLAVLLACGVLAVATRTMARWTGDARLALRQVLAPGLGVQVLLLVLYFLRLTPPVPLAIQRMGIYHEVTKEGRDYLLSQQWPTWGQWWSDARQRGVMDTLLSTPWPSWKVWQSGDQDFLARPGDKVFAFAAVFAPRGFNDEVVARWYYHDPVRGWVSRGERATTVQGTADRGFRTVFSMSYRDVPGDYRVDITTREGHVIGTKYFTILPDPSTGPRVWSVDRSRG